MPPKRKGTRGKTTKGKRTRGRKTREAKPKGTFGFDSGGRYYTIDGTNIKKLSSKTYTPADDAGHLNLTDCTCSNDDCATLDTKAVVD